MNESCSNLFNFKPQGLASDQTLDHLLTGIKGSTFLESGYVFAPYVPLIMTPIIQESSKIRKKWNS